MSYTVSDGILFSKDMTTLVKYPDYRYADSYVIPETVVRLGEYSFSGCQYLTEVEGLGNVSIIETGAFSESFELTQVSLTDTVTKIAPYAFYGCIGLESVIFTDSVKEIGDWAFFGCDGLNSVSFAGSEETWASYGIDQANESLLNATVVFREDGIEMYTQTETANLLTFALRSSAVPPATECTHALGEMEIVVSPSCEVSGVGERKCEFCDYSETEEITATGHLDENTDGICDNCSFDFTEECTCTCHLGGIMSILWKIINFMIKIFGKSHVCPCGVVL